MTRSQSISKQYTGFDFASDAGARAAANKLSFGDTSRGP
eukprot:CAMPEP_0202385960 /NCGR_PEP_ID=MMETSP1127-20130417/63760_1 /ASSEMBLY_ACC=CAM_ASM_000462 /TAXON_ID=3047 /ORGANISM="Dunaliella tertiolecta, Strain CCMP1320" /LENGTH=38 /DNA_ID= /DNA_START= /DNA_END= /DNA_ORIENTATION=